LTLAEGEESDELTVKVVALKESLTALKGALSDHEDAIIADNQIQPDGHPFLHRRTSCRRKVNKSMSVLSNQPSLESKGVVQGGVKG